MAYQLPSYLLPSISYALFRGHQEDGAKHGRYWCTFTPKNGEPQALDEDGWDTAREAQLEAYRHHVEALDQYRTKLVALKCAALARKEKMDEDERVPTADDWEALHDAIMAL